MRDVGGRAMHAGTGHGGTDHRRGGHPQCARGGGGIGTAGMAFVILGFTLAEDAAKSREGRKGKGMTGEVGGAYLSTAWREGNGCGRWRFQCGMAPSPIYANTGTSTG